MSDHVLLQSFIQNLAGARKSAFPSFFAPMLASLAEDAFSRDDWIYEAKLDGMRCLAFYDGSKLTLYSRRAQNISSQYPQLTFSLPTLCKCPLVLDGEIIALNQEGKPSFQLLQKRMNLLKVTDIERAEARIPVQFFVFDLIYADGYNLASCALLDRKEVLNLCLEESKQVRILKHFSGDGKLAYDACIENGFEGIVAKRVKSPYELGRRSPSWLKVKAQKTAEFVIAGYSAGQGSRASTFGALLLAYYEQDDNLIYAGSVGTGFDERLLRDLLKRMQPLESNSCPLKERPADKKDSVWLRPQLVAEIKFMDWTEDRHLRNPVFLHLRQDKEARQVRLQEELKVSDIEQALSSEVQVSESVQDAEIPAAGLITKPCDPDYLHWQAESNELLLQLDGNANNSRVIVEGEEIALTNLDKILFPANQKGPALSKRAFLRLIAFLSPYILRYLQDRPLTMIRAPGGLKSRSFYQKHWNMDIPDFIETVQTDFDEPGRKDQLLCNNLASLIFFAQHNILEYHCGLSRLAPAAVREDAAGGDESSELLNMPDFMVFDLDVHKENAEELEPDLGSFKKASEVALLLKSILEALSLPPFLKTSGRSGLHIFIPLKRDLRFEEVFTLAEQIAKHAVRQAPRLISTSAVEARKEGRVFLDYQANTRGKTIASPYTPRLTRVAGISTPLDWQELPSVYPSDFNQYSIKERLMRIGDIWKQMSDKKVDLSESLKKKP